MNKGLKRLTIIGVLLVLTWTTIWVINYAWYIDKAYGYEKLPDTYYKYEEGYSYTVRCPHYFSLTGNFAISNSDCTVAILIWPNYLKNKQYEDYKFGISILDTKTNMGYRFYSDISGNFVEMKNEKYNATEKKIIAELIYRYEDEIKILFNLAEKEWKGEKK